METPDRGPLSDFRGEGTVLTRKILLALSVLTLAGFCQLQAQTLTNLTHPAPDGATVEMQLTDGTVLVQGFQGQDWYKLTPDINGSYVNGTWTQMANLPSNYDPYAMAEAVLADGRVLIEGGEYNFGSFSFTNLGEIYDPMTNTWTPLTPPPGWDYIGDSPSAVLPNGHFIIGRKFDMQMAELDPATMTWTALGSSGKSDWNAEEGWTLMPNGTLLTVDVLNNPNSEHYIRSEQRWVSDGSTIANLQGPPEVGCIPYGGGTVLSSGRNRQRRAASRRLGVCDRRDTCRRSYGPYGHLSSRRYAGCSGNVDGRTRLPEQRLLGRQLCRAADQRKSSGGRHFRPPL